VTFCVDGAWTRQSVTVDGSEAFETQHVYWLQVGPWYADLRVPFHPAGGTSCFAGRSGWVGDGDRYRWAHELDLAGPCVDDVDRGVPDPLAALADGLGSGPGAEDIGDLTRDRDRLIERGLLGDIPYEEVWVRMPDGEGDRQSEAQLAPDACFVRVGGHSITVVDARLVGGEFGACYQVRTGDEWQVRAVIGPMPVGAMDLGRPNIQDPSRLAGRPR
jgi:hypothetical protein